MGIGNHIRYLRQLRKMTQEDLAGGICSVTYLSKLENNKELPREEILQLLCERLDVELADVLRTCEDLEGDLFEWYRMIELKEKQAAASKREEIQRNLEQVYNVSALHYFSLFDFYFSVSFQLHEIDQSSVSALLDKEEAYSSEQRYYLYYFIGTYYIKQAEYMQSFHYFERSVRLSEHLNLKEGEFFYQYALMLSKINELNKSNYYAETALDLFEQSLHQKRIIDCRVVIGVNYILLGEHDLAEIYLSKIINLLPSQYNNLEIVHHNIGYIYFRKQKYQTALEHLNSSYELKQQKKQERQLIPTLYLKVATHFLLGNTKEPIDMLRMGKRLSKKYDNQKYMFKFDILESLYVGDHSCTSFIERMEEEVLPYFKSKGEMSDYYDLVFLTAKLLENQLKYKKASRLYHQYMVYKRWNGGKTHEETLSQSPIDLWLSLS